MLLHGPNDLIQDLTRMLRTSTSSDPHPAQQPVLFKSDPDHAEVHIDRRETRCIGALAGEPEATVINSPIKS